MIRLLTWLVVFCLLPFAAEAQGTTFSGTCISCKVFEVFDEVAGSYLDQAFAIAAPSAKQALNAAAYLWLMFEIFMYQFNRGTPINDLLPRVVLLMFANFMLHGIQAWMQYVVEPVLGMGLDWASALATAGGLPTGGYSGLNGLLYAAETPTYAVIKPTTAGWNDLAENIARILISAFLIILWAGIWVKIIIALFYAYMRVFVITALSPGLIICLPFEPTRPIFMAGVKECATGALEIVTTALYIGLLSSVMRQISSNFPASMDKGINLESAQGFYFSSEFWILILTGIALWKIHDYFASLPMFLLMHFGMHAKTPTAGDMADGAKKMLQGAQTTGRAAKAAASTSVKGWAKTMNMLDKFLSRSKGK